MREFKVGDRVRWYQIDNRPLWNFNGAYVPVEGLGKWVDGIVTSATNTVFDVSGGWRWPQPGHCRAMYGEPGYLELVETAPEPRFLVFETMSGNLYIRDRHCHDAVEFFPSDSCRHELEALCAKLNEGEQS